MTTVALPSFSARLFPARRGSGAPLVTSFVRTQLLARLVGGHPVPQACAMSREFAGSPCSRAVRRGDPDHRQHRGVQVERLGEVRGEVAENADLDIGERRLGGKSRRCPTEQRRRAPSGVDGGRAFEPFGGAAGVDSGFQNLAPARHRKRRQNLQLLPADATSAPSAGPRLAAVRLTRNGPRRRREPRSGFECAG